tara:strand:+ start:1706 stop:2077 length:372 start_codon:yes stop_codon:yes gene_type:complete
MRASAGLARTIAKALFLRAADFAFSKKGGVKSVNASPLQISFAATSAPGNARDFDAMLASEAGYLGFCASCTLLEDSAEPPLEGGEHPGGIDTTLAFCRAIWKARATEGNRIAPPRTPSLRRL